LLSNPKLTIKYQHKGLSALVEVIFKSDSDEASLIADVKIDAKNGAAIIDIDYLRAGQHSNVDLSYNWRQKSMQFKIESGDENLGPYYWFCECDFKLDNDDAITFNFRNILCAVADTSIIL
jgi:hypothetical protein